MSPTAALSDINAPETPAHEQPLSAARHGLSLLGATGIIALFYLYGALFLVGGALLWLLVALFTLAGVQFGAAIVGEPILRALGAAMKAFARGLWLARGVETHLPLAREQAPQLWREVEALSARLGVSVPDEFVIEGGANAYVGLRGVRAGRGKTRLGLGFDLLAGLSGAQTRAVIAHEIAHAKFVRRGYQGFLMRGLFRLGRCAGALGGMAKHEENGKLVRFVARAVGAWPRYASSIAGKLVAACSRYDEFLADRIAAEICGAPVCRAALLAIQVVEQQAAKIDYRERILQMERGGDCADWLRERLQVPDESKRLEMETRALQRSSRHEMATHPALPDRLAALQTVNCADFGEAPTGTSGLSTEASEKFSNSSEDFSGSGQAPTGASEDFAGSGQERTGSSEDFSGSGQAPTGASGLDWFVDANAVGAQLLRHHERLAAAREAKATQSLARWTRKRERDGRGVARVQSKQFGAVFMAMLGVGMGFYMWDWARDLSDNGTLPYGLALAMVELMPAVFLVAAIDNWRKMPGRAGELPVPPFALYCEQRAARYDQRMMLRTQLVERLHLSEPEKRRLQAADAEIEAQKNIALGAQLRALAPANLTKPADLANFRVARAYEALARCDMDAAFHWVRLIFELDAARDEAHLLHCVSSAAFGWRGRADAKVQAIAAQHGFGGRWALAWIACLEENTALGEALLLPLAGQRPQNATLEALLGWCQLKNGKPREALATRQRALKAAQNSGDLSDEMALAEEACHRHALAFSLMLMGQLAAARVELDWVAAQKARLEARGEKLPGIDDFDVDTMELDWQVGHGNAELALQAAARMQAARPEARTHLDIGDALSDTNDAELLAAAQGHYERALEYGFYPNTKLALSRLAYNREDKVSARALLLEALNTTHRREHNSDHALRYLNDVIEGLRAIDDPLPETVASWEVTLDATGLTMNVKRVFLLCVAPEETGALQVAHELFEAMEPGQTWGERVQIALAAAQYQPAEAMAPGVYNGRFEE